MDTLFEYVRDGRPWTFPEHDRGMDVSDVNYIDETFGPSIVQFADGRVFMTVGKTQLSVVQVHGLPSIRRFTAPAVVVTPELVGAATAYHTTLADFQQEQRETGPLTVSRMPTPPIIDGDFADWGEPRWVVIERQRLGAGFRGRDVDYTVGALAYDQTHLYIALRTRRRNALANEGDPLTPFKTGGALDLHLATVNARADRQAAVAGDVRLLICQVGEKLQAMRYRPVVPGTTEPTVFTTTVAETRIDSIDDVSAEIRLAVGSIELPDRNKTARHEQIEVAIPLSVLGWDPAKLPETLGDLGLLVGQDGVTVQRSYWHNTATGLVSDVPSEARLYPLLWGTWRIAR